MKKLLLASALVFLPASALAADTVNFTMKASMPSLRDDKLKDSFNVGLADTKVETAFKITCQAAQGGLISGTNETCAVTGNGALVNPSNGQKLQRTQYAGGWVVKSDGFTDGANLSVNYLAVGKVPASNDRFGGSMMLKPENPSTSASAIKDAIIKKIKTTEVGPDRRARRYRAVREFHNTFGGASLREGLRVERRHGLRLSDPIVVHRLESEVRWQERQGIRPQGQHAVYREPRCGQPEAV